MADTLVSAPFDTGRAGAATRFVVGVVGIGFVNRPVVGADPVVAAAIAAWSPAGDVSEEHAEVVLPTVRLWVAAAGPVDAHGARRLLRAVTGLASWVYSELGVVDAGTVLDPGNVELWVMRVNRRRSTQWRHVTRAALRSVGRAVNPDGWLTVQPIGRAAAAAPYSTSDEATFRLSAGLSGCVDRPARLWVAAASLGAGMSGPEIAVGCVSDVAEEDGTLTVRVRGRNSRLVPVRSVWAGPVVEAVECLEHSGSGPDRFFVAQGRNAANETAARLAPVYGEGLSLRRARSTWLAAHLVAGTPLLVLRVLAGPVSANTLNVLAAGVCERPDPELAWRQGRGA